MKRNSAYMTSVNPCNKCDDILPSVTHSQKLEIFLQGKDNNPAVSKVLMKASVGTAN